MGEKSSRSSGGADTSEVRGKQIFWGKPVDVGIQCLNFWHLVTLVGDIWPFDIDMVIFVKIFALMHFFSSADEPCWGFPARSIQVLIKSYYMFWNLIEFFQTQFVKIERKQWFSAICSLLWYDISNLLSEQRPIIGKYTLAVTFIKVKNFSWAKH